MEPSFHNPNTISTNIKWSYGFFFHWDDRKRDYVFVTSDGERYCKMYDSYLAEFNIGWSTVDQGAFGIGLLDRLDGSANALKLTVDGTSGRFYLNRTKIADIGVSASPRGSGLGVATVSSTPTVSQGQ
jgi:hypothetical protein